MDNPEMTKTKKQKTNKSHPIALGVNDQKYKIKKLTLWECFVPHVRD